MNTRLLLLASGLLALSPLHAGEEVPAAAADAGKVKPYQLKKRSAFATLSEDSRIPFWPIGWKKPKPGEVVTADVAQVHSLKVDINEKQFKVSSILLGEPSFAIINGRTYGEGDFVRLPRPATAGNSAPSAPSARVRVYRIDDGCVQLQHQDEVFTIALQRPELAQRTGEEDLLLEDRP